MQATSDDSCMYWVRLPAGSEGGTLKVNDSFILNVTDFSVEAGEGCDTVAMIGEGNIIESNDTSLIGQPDSENNDSVKWGWVCKR
jgi:hypothetical protein